MTTPIFGKYTFDYYGRDFELNTISYENSNDVVFIAPNSRQRVDIEWSEQGRYYNIVRYDELGNHDRQGQWLKVTNREGAIKTACTQLLVDAGKL